MNRQLHLDFDETAFNHIAFATWLDEVFVRQFHTEPGAFNTSFANHHRYLDNGMRLYDSAGHVQAVTGRPWSYVAGVIDQEFRNANEPDFCYPDVHPAVTELVHEIEDVRILTFGQDGYQRYKIGTCALMRRLVTHVVDEPKNQFLSREFAEHPGILVDDKYPLGLPEHWIHLWINREEPLAQPKQIDQLTWQISHLGQVLPTIKQING